MVDLCGLTPTQIGTSSPLDEFSVILLNCETFALVSTHMGFPEGHWGAGGGGGGKTNPRLYA